jgi:lipid-binding SYLF domain-containing protein
MKRYLALLACFLLAGAGLYAQAKEQDRLVNSGVVLEEILNTPENIPRELIEKANCVVVFPSVMKLAFGFGASYGRGAMVCRTGKDFRGPWGAPAMFALEGGSFGLQIGGQATDFVLLVMNKRGADSILRSKVKLGGNISVAAGPVGRAASAETDAALRAEVLSYSRSRGLFAGISLAGSSIRQDKNANAEIYGRKISARDIVLHNKVGIPEAGRHLVDVLQKNAPRNESAQASSRSPGL